MNAITVGECSRLQMDRVCFAAIPAYTVWRRMKG